MASLIEKFKWSEFGLQKKALIVACLGLVFWLIVFCLVFMEIEGLNKAIIHLERVEDLYDAIHDMRRYEKNFLLYQGRENLEQMVHFHDKARQAYLSMEQWPDIFSGIQKDMDQLKKDFHEYGQMIDYFKPGNSVNQSGPNEEKIRNVGNRMINLAKELLVHNRKKVGRTAAEAIRLPLIFTGVVVFLFFIGLWVINRRVVKPLAKLEQATRKIGRGDFEPVSHPGRVESEVDRLVFAFNRMVEELDARQEQIIHARKIASLGTLVSGVAHELNNPINNIILTVDTLVGKREVPEEKKARMMEDILAQAIRASEIVKNLLSFSRAEVSSMTDVDLKFLLEDIFRIVDNELAMKSIQLDKRIDPDLPLINGNRQGLQQVFSNLIINAVQAMSENGRLTVTGTLEDGNWVVIKVQDTGKGIPEEDLSHIFDPFFTTKEVGKGTGLGLSVSYGIIKKHGGRVTVESETDSGTTFSVMLPAKEEEDIDE